MEQGKFHEAAVSLRVLKSLNRSDVSARASLIQACLKSDSRAEAIAEIDDLLQSRTIDLPQGLELAKVLADEREIQAAQHLLEGRVIVWPASPEARGELGLSFAQSGDILQAAQELDHAARLNPDSERYGLAYGEVLLRSQKYSEALSYLSSVQSKFSRQPEFQYQLALTHMYLLRFSEATAELENLESDLPRSARVRFLLAGCYEVQGELQKAEASYRMAIQIDPNDPGYYRALGSMLQKQGVDHIADAVQVLRTSLSLDPNDPDSKIILARCLQKQGRLEEAATLLEQTVGSVPDSRRAHTALAELYLHQGQAERAAKEQEVATKLEDEKIKDWDARRTQSLGGP
jgi:tetratricopeptide (TPR) repeat protein